ncbi:MAG: Branched-chain amino acid transporter, amino acid-binding protein, partial [Fibrobacteres bacterium]|nr:Branched-chain amino acid transporter, amino acid-binding protein [Fibrobacterota bacterium]
TAVLTVDGAAAATFPFTDASGYQSWKDVKAASVNLSAGSHVFRITMGSASFNLNHIDVAAATNKGPVAKAGPDRIVAANTLVTLDGSGSFDPDNGPKPLSYQWGAEPKTLVGSPQSAKATFTPYAAGTFRFNLVVSDGLLTHGDSLVITAVTAPEPLKIPGRVQAEDYRIGGEGYGYHDLSAGNAGGAYRKDDVDIQGTADAGGGYNVGWTQTGEWLDYDVNVAIGGTFNVTARLASGSTGAKSAILSLDGNGLGAFELTAPSGTQSWKDVAKSGVSLTQGRHNLRIAIGTGGLNLNYVDFARIPDGNADLSALSLSAGPVNPAFDAATQSYTVNVANGVVSTTVTPTAAAGTATVQVNGIPVASGSASSPIPLAVGTTPLSILVQAENGIRKAYDVQVIRSAGVHVSKVSGGAFHTLILRSDGTLWAAGRNDYGQLGDGTTLQRNSPVQVLTGVADVSAGGFHSLILKTDGTLWAAGQNGFGQLGDGTSIQREAPVQIASGVVSLSAGVQHGFFLKADGTLWGMGLNTSGQLGDGTTLNRASPVLIPVGPAGVRSVAAGQTHSLLLKGDGTLWSTGANTHGELGNGTTSNRPTFGQILSGVSGMAAGVDHTLIVKSDGSLWSNGFNINGQLGDGTTTQRLTPVPILMGVSAVSAGFTFSQILKTDGTVLACGYNVYGQLGDGTTVRRLSPVPVMSGVTAISAGHWHSLFLKVDSSVWSTGENQFGELGDGTTTDRYAPVRIP